LPPTLNRLIADFANSSLAQYYVAQQVKTEKPRARSSTCCNTAVAWAGGEAQPPVGAARRLRHRQDRVYPPFRPRAGTAGARPDEQPTAVDAAADQPCATTRTRPASATSCTSTGTDQTGERRDPAIFLHLLARGRIVLLLDSFDEMGISQAHRNVVEQFRMLAQPTGSAGDGARGNRVLVTCREQFFREHGEALQAMRGESDRLAALEQAARGFDGTIDVLPRFTDTQIQEYLQSRLGARESERAWRAIECIYHLRGLADRPQLLEMIIDSLPELLRSGQTVSAGALYLRYTNRWLEDPAIRPADRQCSSEQLRAVLETLAVELWRA
jgi:hypothetical protein